jgi:hypothetical protein
MIGCMIDSQQAVPLFELTKRNIDFMWNLGYQQAFELLKRTLVDALVLIQPYFKKPFCFDVD